MKNYSTVRLALLVLLLLVNAPASAQEQDPPPFSFGNEFGLNNGLNINEPDEKASFKASFLVDEGGKTGKLQVTASVIPGWHIFSVTQPKGGPQRTIIQLDPGFSDARISGPFQPDSDFHIVNAEGFDVPQEEHEGTVVWTAQLTFAQGVKAHELSIPVKIRQAQVCESKPFGTCLQYSPSLVAKSTTLPDTFTGEFRPENVPATIRGWVDRTQAQPGDIVKLTIELLADPGFAIPEVTQQILPGQQPTLVVLSLSHRAVLQPPASSSSPVEVTSGELVRQIHVEPVAWEFPIQLPKDLESSDLTFNGWIGFGPVKETGELAGDPVAVQFIFDLGIGTTSNETKNDLEFLVPDNASYVAVSEIIQKQFQQGHANAGALADYPISAILGFAFLAGLILNIMPCVLPVIGIKVLSFVQQAGENPRRVLMLNLVFAAGIISVFLFLALLASFPQVLGLEKKLGWGGLFESQAFVITMVAIVFAFGLSFLGIWEIPIPGFVSTAGSGKAAQQEGYNGAFLKGVLTTLLATPCSGPLLIPVVTWGTAQPPALTFLVFFALGVGMAFPFILIGFRPSLVSWLPKPGDWMETFKQWMGFILIGGAIFFYGAVTDKIKIPVLAFLLFIAIACWMAGRISFIDTAAVRMKKWAMAVGMLLLGAFVSFYLLIPQHELDWKPFSLASVDEIVADGNIVFVDFTADW